jgi:hypothetical protein
MSNLSETGLNLEDLELQLLPAWARQAPDTQRFSKYQGGEETTTQRRDRRDRPERRGERPVGADRRPVGTRGPGGRDPRDRGGGRRDERFRREEMRDPVQPLPEVNASLIPEENGVESLARQIKLTGRAYPVFDIAHLILKKPDRYHVTFSVVKKADGSVAQQLWLCNLDDTLWLSESDAISHVLRRHFETFYKPERTPTDPPKGTYTFVAQCGLSGTILGPPNYHDYQNKLRKLHAERFSRMPFEVYKAKVRIVKDEPTVKKWTEEQSWKIEYLCLNVPEAKKLGSREEVEKHFRETHLANIIRTVESHTLNGAAAQQLPAEPLRQLLRRAWDEQHRFPLKVVTTLSQQLAAHGLQFFKVNKTITHVSVARPHYLDLEATPVSEGIKRIVDYINANSGCTRRKLIEALAPTPAAASALTEPVAPPGVTTEQSAAAPVAASSVAIESPTPTPEQTAVIADLHWLIHQGHVLEFANGRIETARKPNPRPVKPEPKPGAVSVPDGEGPLSSEPNAPATPGPTTEAASETTPADASGGETPVPAESANETTRETT